MKRTITKKDLHTGDIIENRAGERGVVILETDCIVYQGGGLDIIEEVFTDDLFVDGTDRSADIFKVYRDSDGCLGFNKLFGPDPIYVRKNDKHTRERAAELTDKHDGKKGKVTTLIMEPTFRSYHLSYIDPSKQDDHCHCMDLDFAMSEAPSMTALGQVKIDRTFIAIPGTDKLFFVYNKYQEERHLQKVKEGIMGCMREEEKDPIISIAEGNIAVHSRCLLVRRDDSGRITNLQEGDIDRAKPYMVKMKEKEVTGNRWF